MYFAAPISRPIAHIRCIAVFFLILVGPSSVPRQANAQTRRSVFQSGEQLVYKVKYGFIKLGTLIIETGPSQGGNQVLARMKFWTAEVPFLDTKDLVTDVIDSHQVCLMKFEEHLRDGDKKVNRSFVYDKEARTLTYSDDVIKQKVLTDVRPFCDALTLVFAMRTWSASGQSYGFPMRGKDGERTVTCHFTRHEEMTDCPAFEDKEIKTRIIDGQADMGDSSPLGANGKFTIYITEDEAAIPIRIEMSIAVGSITLVLDKVTRSGWHP